MKKFVSFMLAVLFVALIPSAAVRAAESDLYKIQEQVEKTNREIDKEIVDAVEAANIQIKDYREQLCKATEGKEGVEYLRKIEELDNLKTSLNSLTVGTKQYNDVAKNIGSVATKITNLQYRIDEKKAKLDQRIEELEGLEQSLKNISPDSKDHHNVSKRIDDIKEKIKKLNEKRESKLNKIEKDFVKKLDEMINELIDTTNDKAQKMVNNAAKYGIIVKCEWVEVEIGGRSILVDPLRVIAH